MGPEVFYGYCHDTKRMRMMDYQDFMSNLGAGYQNIYTNMPEQMKTYARAWGYRPAQEGEFREHDCGCHQHHEDDCRCHEHHEHDCCCHEHEHDCHCSCCIRCADAVEYAHCGEVLMIPITLDNDTRREREVKLKLGAFATAHGHELGWNASFAETEFKLHPCEDKTVLLRVEVDCSKFGEPRVEGEKQPTVCECKVAYANVVAEGCRIRPIVVAVAVLPNDCKSHHIGCGCGCCECGCC